MNTLIKISALSFAISMIASTALADSKRPWLHTSDDFWSQQSHARTYTAADVCRAAPGGIATGIFLRAGAHV